MRQYAKVGVEKRAFESNSGVATADSGDFSYMARSLIWERNEGEKKKQRSERQGWQR